MGRDWAAYSLWCFSTWYWQLCWTVLFSTRSPVLIPLLIRAGYSGIVFIPVTLYHFVVSFLRRDDQMKKVRFSYILGIFFSVVVWVDSVFVKGYATHQWGYYPTAGFLHPFFMIFLALLVLHAVFLLLTELSLTPRFSVRHNQIKWVTGAIVAYTPASADFIVNYGASFYPFGFVFTFVSFFMVTYAITKHKLLDITLIIRKTIVYSVVTGSLMVIYLIVVTLFAHAFEGLTGYQTVFSSAVAVGLITMGFQPLRKRVQAFVDRKFFRQYVDREEKLYELSREVITHTTPEAMGQALIHVLEDTLHPKGGALYLRSKEGSGFSRVSSFGTFDLPNRMEEENELTRYFKTHSQPFIREVSEDVAESRSTRVKDERKDAA
jgi:hypothetical protein